VTRPRAGARTPRALGFRMPAEWSPHAATWIAWPHERSDWPGRFATIPRVYVGIVRELLRGERVEILVESRPAERAVRRALARADVDLERVGFHRWRTDRSWLRDSGPTFVARPRARGPGFTAVGTVRWRFNAWAKYPNWRRDAQVGRRIARAVGGPTWAPAVRGRRIVLEGGAIDSNGAGILLTTEECLLSREQARNPGRSPGDLEAVFSDYLGVDRVLWLPGGIVGDDTHGHVDDAARFAGPATIVAAVEPEPADPNHARLEANRARLRAIEGRVRPRIRVVELPMPRPIRYRGQRLPASYANFYVANASVLVPTFGDPGDERAIATLRALFTGREVVGIPCRDLVLGLGTLHCLTQPEFAVDGQRAGGRGGEGRKFK
jgi:agmatine deiminase